MRLVREDVAGLLRETRRRSGTNASGTCDQHMPGVDDQAGLVRMARADERLIPNVTAVCNVFIDLDPTFVALQQTSGKAILEALLVMQQVAAVFAAQRESLLGMELRVVGVALVPRTLRAATSRVVLEKYEAYADDRDDAVPLGGVEPPRGKDVCLNHLFIYTQLNGILGIAEVGSSSRGMCGLTSGQRAYNSGLTNVMNGDGVPLAMTQAAAATAHEFGHNFGASHDCTLQSEGPLVCKSGSAIQSPTPGTSCVPDSSEGGQFLMYPVVSQSPDMQLTNALRLSPCSLDAIRRVLSLYGGRTLSNGERCLTDPATTPCNVGADEPCFGSGPAPGKGCSLVAASRSTTCSTPCGPGLRVVTQSCQCPDSADAAIPGMCGGVPFPSTSSEPCEVVPKCDSRAGKFITIVLASTDGKSLLNELDNALEEALGFVVQTSALGFVGDGMLGYLHKACLIEDGNECMSNEELYNRVFSAKVLIERSLGVSIAQVTRGDHLNEDGATKTHEVVLLVLLCTCPFAVIFLGYNLGIDLRRRYDRKHREHIKTWQRNVYASRTASVLRSEGSLRIVRPTQRASSTTPAPPQGSSYYDAAATPLFHGDEAIYSAPEHMEDMDVTTAADVLPRLEGDDGDTSDCFTSDGEDDAPRQVRVDNLCGQQTEI